MDAVMENKLYELIDKIEAIHSKMERLAEEIPEIANVHYQLDNMVFHYDKGKDGVAFGYDGKRYLINCMFEEKEYDMLIAYGEKGPYRIAKIEFRPELLDEYNMSHYMWVADYEDDAGIEGKVIESSNMEVLFEDDKKDPEHEVLIPLSDSVRKLDIETMDGFLKPLYDFIVLLDKHYS